MQELRLIYCVCTGFPCIEIETLNLFSFGLHLVVGKFIYMYVYLYINHPLCELVPGAHMTSHSSDFHFPHIHLIWRSSGIRGKLRQKRLKFQAETNFKEQFLKRLRCVGLIDIQQGAHLAGANIRLAQRGLPPSLIIYVNHERPSLYERPLPPCPCHLYGPQKPHKQEDLQCTPQINLRAVVLPLNLICSTQCNLTFLQI